jgi:hypothetical protein
LSTGTEKSGNHPWAQDAQASLFFQQAIGTQWAAYPKQRNGSDL